MKQMIQVIIVNQDQEQNSGIEKTIRNSGLNCNVKIAVNGGQALLQIDHLHLIQKINDKPILVLLDINTPIVNGYEFLHQYKIARNLRKENIHIVVIDKGLSQTQKTKVENLGISIFVSLLSSPKGLMEIINSTIPCNQNNNNSAAIAA